MDPEMRPDLNVYEITGFFDAEQDRGKRKIGSIEKPPEAREGAKEHR